MAIILKSTTTSGIVSATTFILISGEILVSSTQKKAFKTPE